MNCQISPSGRVLMAAALATVACTGLEADELSSDAAGNPWGAASTAAIRPGARYTVVGVASDRCLDVGARGAGGEIHIARCGGGPRQHWHADDAGGGHVRLRNGATELCMDVASASTARGARIIQSACSSAASQGLAASERGDGAWELTVRHSGLVLDVDGARTSEGAPLIQWTRTGRGNQQFRLVPVDDDDDGGEPTVCAMATSTTAYPFGCELAWGTNGNSGNRSSFLAFITTWVGYEANGGLDGGCDGCGLVRSLASTDVIPTYYAYFIGFQASAAGFGDCNTDFDGENLCNRGAQWLRAHRSRVVSMYGNYARMTHAANPDGRVAWLLDGDFIQYTYPEQSAPFSMQELGELTSEIVCAIKANQPGAIVALNHASWMRNPTLTRYFDAMPLDLIDLVWTTGVGNADGYLNRGDAYGRVDGSYAYLHGLTGKNLLVDTSFGASQQSDSWTSIGASTLNQRIADGVIAVNVTSPPPDFQARITALAPSLSPTCR